MDNRNWTDFSKVDKLVDNMIKNGLNSLGNDVKKRAIILAPKDTGALRQSARVDISAKGDTATTSFNTAYARVRHRLIICTPLLEDI